MSTRLTTTAVSTARALIVAVLLTLAGCATREPVPEPTPAVDIPESTWRLVDRDIATASLAARGPAGNYARGVMQAWIERIRQRTDEDFIPWYTSYWTQQWLAVKVAWYQLGDGEGPDPVSRRLAAYLQEQYQERVMNPVREEIDPDQVMRHTTRLYVRLLAEQLPRIPVRYGVPGEQFERRLEAIPAIALAPPPAHGASLYQLVHAQPIDELPAYAALLADIRKAMGNAEGGPSEARISPVAQRTAERLVNKLAISGGASAAAAAVGGVAGMVISLGAAGIGAIAHASELPELEAQLRESLDAAQHQMWQTLVEDPRTGVMAGMAHIAGEVEGSLAYTPALVIEIETGEPVEDDGREGGFAGERDNAEE